MSGRLVWRALWPALIAAVTVVGLAGTARAADTGLDGVITDAATGAPVAGAWVEAWDSSGVDHGGAGTDSTGHYDLTWLAPGGWRLKVIAQGYADQWAFGKGDLSSADTVVAPGTASLALEPLRYGSIAGTLRTRAGDPVPDTFVEFWDNGNPRGSTSSAADGSFHFTHVLAGTYQVSYRLPGGATLWTHDRSSEVEADPVVVTGDQETRVDETIPDLGDLEVTVIDEASGAPLAGACVSDVGGPQWISACSDTSGVARVTGILTGTYTDLSVSPPDGYLFGHLDAVTVGADGTTRVTIPLTRASSLVLAFRDRATGAPVANVCATLLSATASDAGHYGGTCGGSGDTLSWNQLPAGEYKLFVTPNDGVHGSQWVGPDGGTGDPRAAAVIEVAVGATVQVPVSLDGAGSISGTVTDAQTGAPVQGLCTSVNPVDTNGAQAPSDAFCTDAGGHYTLANLGPYRWAVEFPDFHGTYAWQWSGGASDRFAATRVTVPVGGTATVDAHLVPTGKVTGHVIGATVPPSLVAVSAVDARTGDAAGPRALVDSGYGYTLKGLATQRIRIAFSATPGAENVFWYPTPVCAVAGRTVSGIDLRVPGP